MKRHGNSPALSPLCDCTCMKSAVGLRQEQTSVYRLGLCTCMHMRHRPRHSSGGNTVLLFLFFWNLICCKWGLGKFSCDCFTSLVFHKCEFILILNICLGICFLLKCIRFWYCKKYLRFVWTVHLFDIFIKECF